MSKLLAKAIAIAATAHKDDVDKGGKAYILHPIRIMMRLRTDNDHLNVCAILHDVLEDHPEFAEEIDKLELTQPMRHTLDCLTHKDGEPYMDYIIRISKDREATFLKMGDIKDNSDVTRLKGVRQKDLDRVVKYNKAYMFLKEAVEEYGY